MSPNTDFIAYQTILSQEIAFNEKMRWISRFIENFLHHEWIFFISKSLKDDFFSYSYKKSENAKQFKLM